MKLALRASQPKHATRHSRPTSSTKKRTRPATFKKILVPTDFSMAARRPLQRAARLGLARGARIHLVHVVPGNGKALPPASREATSANMADAEAFLVKALRDAGAEHVTVHTRVLTGEPYVEIIRYARETDAELIVLARKGAGLGMGRVLGTTASRVLRMSESPVLVVSEDSPHRYARPLIALPLDPSGRKLVDLVHRVTGDRSKTLDAVRAYHVPFAGFVSAGSDENPSDYHRSFKDAAASAVQAQLRSLARHGTQVRAALRHGDSRSVILEEARRMHADLIAVGTHGRSGLAHVLLGSVAEWVILNAPTDVLVARPVHFTFELP